MFKLWRYGLVVSVFVIAGLLSAPDVLCTNRQGIAMLQALSTERPPDTLSDCQESRYFAGVLHFVRGEYEQTIALLEPTAETTSLQGQFQWYWVGKAYNRLSQPTAHIEAWSQLPILAVRLVREGRTATPMEAIEQFRLAVALDPMYAEGWQRLGETLADFALTLPEAERPLLWQEAEAAIQQAILLNEENLELHYTLGKIYTDAGFNQLALVELNYFLANSSDSFLMYWAYVNLGHTYQALATDANEDPTYLRTAVAHYQQAIMLQPETVDPYMPLANTYRRLGETEQALMTLRQLDPKQLNSTMARQLLQHYLQLGQIEIANQLLAYFATEHSEVNYCQTLESWRHYLDVCQ